MLDETTKTGQDTSSGKAGQSSGSKGGITSKGKLFTDADIAKIKSDAAAEAGRLRKAAETERDSLKQQLQDTNSRLDALERQENESRLAEARGDPDQLRYYQREQSVSKREREIQDQLRDITRREAQLKSDQAEVEKDRGVVSIAYIAAKHGLDSERLEKFKNLDLESLEAVAEEIAAGKGTTAKPPEGGEGGEVGEEWSPDSGEGTGGGAETLTTESVDVMSLPALEKAMNKTSEK